MLRSALLAAALISAPLAAQPIDASHPTVVELYQSQGCSSCPPAITNLNAVADRPDVLALTFAVTYWDQLGWKDTFASAAQTSRQWDYARGLHHDQVWTPQVIVDGTSDVVGAQHGQIEGALKGVRRRAGPALILAADSVAVGSGSVPVGGADVWLVRYDPRTIAVAIRAGENTGRTIGHRNVVRQLVKLGKWDGAAATLKLPAAAPGLLTAVLVQTSGGPILAAVRG
ncbi:DUF1223 domain-containing protein [Polymorphobacter sp. PAMC 29334]|uniref:DUF1223 domain-containing protein n=1 Tax=Polymorphobacter sp. PAMC 29334 TaxID=2862331 RepID=UPI001C66394E|nr:DUF1223 domain-containing protein [Polymorphobacter sp. PAMC 29334]QYE35016.1 DUF1223 domain-containing protein [Polymorphobacter sp. PAMC 29334]